MKKLKKNFFNISFISFFSLVIVSQFFPNHFQASAVETPNMNYDFIAPSEKANTNYDFIGTLEPKLIKIDSQVIDPTNVDSTVKTVVEFLLNLSFGIAVLLVLGNIIFGAFEWITSGGKSDKIKNGKDRILWAIIGLFLVASAYGITVLVQGIFIDNGGKLSIDLIKK